MRQSTIEIRNMFLEFFQSKGHHVVPSGSLVPLNDPSLLFTNAGMNQFKNWFLNPNQCQYKKIATSQHCLRAGGKHNDLENVGYTTRHHTFFEMLGNFSFGDYFKCDAIHLAWELLTSKKWFNLSKEKLWITVHAEDNESYNIWVNEVGVPSEKISRIEDNSKNFWTMGNTGPCGPCSEIFYDRGEHIQDEPFNSLHYEDNRYVELWNLVFIQFNRQVNGTLIPLSTRSVDTGMGLERLASVLQSVCSNYDIDLFNQIIASISAIIHTKNPDKKSLCVIADHIRASAFLISEGIFPANEGKGYVLRRIIRRAIRHGNILGANSAFLYKLVLPLIEIMGESANLLRVQKTTVEQVLLSEEKQFERTLKRGLILLHKEINKLTGNILDGKIAFHLYDTYGFPIDLTAEICREHNLKLDMLSFDNAMKIQRSRARQSSKFCSNYHLTLDTNKHTIFSGYDKLVHQAKIIALFFNDYSVQDISQTNKEIIVVLDKTPFYGASGGQIGDQGKLEADNGVFEVTDTKKYGNVLFHIGTLTYGKLKIGTHVLAQVNAIRRKRISINHSATHLLHESLRQVLGQYVSQRGSLVSDQLLRFDFSYAETITRNKIQDIESIVNTQIRHNLRIFSESMEIEDAIQKNVVRLLDKQYATQVRVLHIESFSSELCSGTHANWTGEIGLFIITENYSVASNVYRIEAYTGEKALELVHQQRNLLHSITQLVKSDKKTVLNKIRKLQSRSLELTQELQILMNYQATQISILLSKKARVMNGINILVNRLESCEVKLLKSVVNHLKLSLRPAVIVLFTEKNGKTSLVAGVTKDLVNKLQAKDVVYYLIEQIGGKGGGNDNIAQISEGNSSSLPAALTNLDKLLTEKIGVF